MFIVKDRLGNIGFCTTHAFQPVHPAERVFGWIADHDAKRHRHEASA